MQGFKLSLLQTLKFKPGLCRKVRAAPDCQVLILLAGGGDLEQPSVHQVKEDEVAAEVQPDEAPLVQAGALPDPEGASCT